MRGRRRETHAREARVEAPIAAQIVPLRRDRRDDSSLVGQGTFVVSVDGASLMATTTGYDAQLRQFRQRTAWDRA